MHVKTSVLCLLLALCLLPFLASPANLPHHDPVPGGVAVVPLGLTTSEPPAVQSEAGRVMVVWHREQWTAVVGIPLTASLGVHVLTPQQEEGADKRWTFTVRDKQYEQEWITLKNPRMVNPTPDDLERIARDTKQINVALTQHTSKALVDVSFVPPVQGRWSSPFGLRRYYNGQPRRPHSGLDIAAPEGTPVRAPAPGRVVEAGDYFFNGKTLFLEHGQGLVTMYCHLQRIDVKPGQMVKQGERIGAVGQTGRVTGAHLHWSVSLNHTMVDPVLFLPDAVVAKQQAQQQTATPDLKAGKDEKVDSK
jgi:biotin carboxyl carrier protein